jgi:hypothetical protein
MPATLKEEPDALLALVNPVLQKARRCDVPGLVTQRMRLAHVPRQYRIVISKFSDHVERLNVLSIVVSDTLKARDLPDRANGCASEFSSSFSNGIRHGEYLAALVVEHQMIITEMGPGHMPVKILGFEVQRKRIRKKQLQRLRDVKNRVFRRVVGVVSGALSSISFSSLIVGWTRFVTAGHAA